MNSYSFVLFTRFLFSSGFPAGFSCCRFSCCRFSCCRVLLVHTLFFFVGGHVRSSPQLSRIIDTHKHLWFMLWQSYETWVLMNYHIQQAENVVGTLQNATLWLTFAGKIRFNSLQVQCKQAKVRLCILQVSINILWYIFYIKLFCCPQRWTFGLFIPPNWLDK